MRRLPGRLMSPSVQPVIRRPNSVRANFDARLSTPFSEQGLVNGALLEGLGIEGEAAIVPGDPMRSVILHRVSLIGEGAMPPLAKNRVDDNGIALLEEWILRMDSEGSSVADDGRNFIGSGSGGGIWSWFSMTLMLSFFPLEGVGVCFAARRLHTLALTKTRSAARPIKVSGTQPRKVQ